MVAIGRIYLKAQEYSQRGDVLISAIPEVMLVGHYQPLIKDPE